MATKCAVCGLPAHRYSTADPHHKYDAIACVNGLLPALDDATRRANELEATLQQLLNTFAEPPTAETLRRIKTVLDEAIAGAHGEGE